jgi:hypothetical protein
MSESIRDILDAVIGITETLSQHTIETTGKKLMIPDDVYQNLVADAVCALYQANKNIVLKLIPVVRAWKAAARIGVT